MDYNINFPNLNIYMEEVGKNITIGDFSIAFYGITIAIGMLLAIILATTIAKKKDVAGLACACETRLLQKLAGYYEKIYGQEEILEESVKIAEGTEDTLAQASYYHENIIPVMEELRSYADAAEEYIPDELLPYPTYEKLLFSI